MGPEGWIKLIKGLEHLCYEQRLRAEAVQPTEEKAPGCVHCDFQYLKGLIKKMERDSLLDQIMTGQGGMVLN